MINALIRDRGHAVVNTNEDAIILDDVSQGVALYKLSVTDRLKTFPVPHTERRSRNVAFHDGGSTIISGSDHGKVYIFNRRTGDIHNIIYTGFKDWVQSIAVRRISLSCGYCQVRHRQSKLLELPSYSLADLEKI